MQTDSGIADNGHETIAYSVVRNARSRRIRIAVYPNGDVVVRYPSGMPLAQVERFVRENAEWIRRSVGQMKSQPSRLIALQDRAIIPVFGVDYTVKVEADHGDGGHVDGKTVYFSSEEIGRKTARALLFEFYARQLESYLNERIAKMEALTGLSAKKYRIREYRSKWGSCSPTGTISFNLKLAAFPPRVIDYVIVHELCHLRNHDHSRSFWRLVSEYVDDTDALRAELRHEARYNIFA